MLSKRRITVLVSIAALLLLVVAGGVTWVVLNAHAPNSAAAHSTDARSNPATPTRPTQMTPGSGATEGSYADVVAFTPSLQKKADTVALAASSWDGTQSAEQRVGVYLTAGMSQELARSYVPVWSQIFGTNVTAGITSNLAYGKPALNSVTGTAGHLTFVVGVTITYQGTWQQNGLMHSQQPATATWFLTLDQASGLVTKIQQPDASSIQIRTS